MTTTGSPSTRESAAAAEHVVEGNGAGAEKDQCECDCCGCHGKLIPGAIGRAQQPTVQMHFPDCDAEINARGSRGRTGEESDDKKQPAEELRECRDIAEPGGKSHAANGVREAVQPTENLVIAMSGHDGAERHTHHEKS